MLEVDNKETTGAWIVHHGRKVNQDILGASEFPVIDEAAKAADLLSRLAASDQETLTNQEVDALSKSARINPRTELQHLLSLLQQKRLIDQTENGIEVLGITTRAVLSHSATIFEDAKPSKEELASITLAEKTSERPILRSEIGEYLGDTHQMSENEVNHLLSRSYEIGFVDAEGKQDDCLLFNGNLFRKDNIEKTNLVLNSLSYEEQTKIRDYPLDLSK